MKKGGNEGKVRVIVFTFNNISVLLVEETGETHQPVASH